MIIYAILNKINCKYYIGQTTRTLEQRLLEHRHCQKTAISKAIKKYGWGNFSVSILENCETLDQLNEREKFWIAEYNSMAPNGYNLTEGGNNGIFSDESRLKLSMANKGKKISKETCKKISAAKTGTKLSAQKRQKMSILRKGRPKSDATRAKMKLAQAKNRKKVRCIETGEIFESIIMAAERYGINSGEISDVCNKKRNTAGEMHWIILEEWLNITDKDALQSDLLEKPAHCRKSIRPQKYLSGLQKVKPNVSRNALGNL